MQTIYVGIDDTDSSEGMCTTYITSVIIDELKHFGYEIESYPRLIRLNPFVKFKTRGNGALSFKLNVKSSNHLEDIKDVILSKIKEFSHFQDPQTDPGIVIYNGEITEKLKSYSIDAIKNIITIEDAYEFVNEIGAEIFKFKKGRGVIGALAAIGCPFTDKTYELLAYRLPENYGKKRIIDYESVFKMNHETYPQTFDNVDEEYVVIEPHTNCPILYGIRGESSEAVFNAHKMIKTSESIERIAIFETNQHTDMHLTRAENISEMKKFQCYIVDGIVKTPPYTIKGGHVIFILKDDSGEIPCAAYEPTKGFREIIRKLAKYDELRVYGGIGNKGTLNIEKISIINLAKIYKQSNPICECGKRMKSAGQQKGYKCKKCGREIPQIPKKLIEIEREINLGYYEVPPSARRHLSKPLIRIP
jgi:tRNA(Ile2)-agmatinylcytidine synthase